ncbi:DUF6484 domain-containing protein [Cystobacter ferrugineus]|uniref:DUF6484 domain-containing protein n=1 Tax=Cystobacter ferrugineus TaxID=83449 RepID=A0A1L9BI37_9BACT|nr:DUF6484 domain-containing protein [Cystobacter ferrugineus]OJH41952.1 hypothetical protein BON30_01605 [Cystobacter ferrugineus]
MKRLPSSPHTSSLEVTLEPLWESHVGQIVATDGKGRPIVDFEGNPFGPHVARKTVRLEADELQAAVEARQPVELRFEDGDARRPIIMALLPIALRSALSAALPSTPTEPDESPTRVLEGQDGLSLHCGDASLRLLRNGKVVLRGKSIETTAEGTLRVKGMSVQLDGPGAHATPAGRREALPQVAPGALQGVDTADIHVIQGKESLVLRCGRASLTLLRNGRILLKGTYVETCAEGVNRLQAGAVKIN